MSTRAVITFTDKDGQHSVYQHCDGYPEGVLPNIKKSFKFAWPLPRFEADDFAAAFVAANKDGGGGIRLSRGYEEHGDLEYRYEVSHDETDEKKIIVKIFDVNNSDLSLPRYKELNVIKISGDQS